MEKIDKNLLRKYIAPIEGSLEKKVWQTTGLTLQSLHERITEKEVKPNMDLLIHNKCNKNCRHCFFTTTSDKSIEEKNYSQQLKSGLKIIKLFSIYVCTHVKSQPKKDCYHFTVKSTKTKFSPMPNV